MMARLEMKENGLVKQLTNLPTDQLIALSHLMMTHVSTPGTRAPELNQGTGKSLRRNRRPVKVTMMIWRSYTVLLTSICMRSVEQRS